MLKVLKISWFSSEIIAEIFKKMMVFKSTNNQKILLVSLTNIFNLLTDVCSSLLLRITINSS